MSETGEFLLVRLGARLVGLPIGFIIAVEALGPIHPVPTSEPACRGVTRTRGRIMPVLSLADLIGQTGDVTGGTAILLVLSGKSLCLEVDDAESIIRGNPLPLPREEALPWASGVIRLTNELIPLVDLEAIGERLTIPEAVS
jgi:chemotaxis signal transduction protein